MTDQTPPDQTPPDPTPPDPTPTDRPPRVSLANPREKIGFTGERCTPWVTDPVLAEHLHRYLSVLDLTAGKRVLDIACGEGYGAALIAGAGAAAVTGADIDAATVARAARIYGRPGLDFAVTDIRTALPFADQSFDVIVCMETIEHIGEQAAFVAELHRVLTADGVLIMSTPDSATSPPDTPNPFHVRELDTGDFRALLGAHFAHLRLSRQRFFCGSVMVAEDGFAQPVDFWQREGFLDYSRQAQPKATRYMIMTASNQAPVALPTGLLHDGNIMTTLRRMAEAGTSQRQSTQ